MLVVMDNPREFSVIGQGSEEELRQVAEEILLKWAGRYDLEIVRPDGTVYVRHQLRLRHRDFIASDESCWVP